MRYNFIYLTIRVYIFMITHLYNRHKFRYLYAFYPSASRAYELKIIRNNSLIPFKLPLKNDYLAGKNSN
jgi:hypothetical protein